MAEQDMDHSEGNVDFEAALAAAIAARDTAAGCVEAERPEAEAFVRRMRLLGERAADARSTVTRLCSQQATRLNGQFERGDIPVDSMIQQAFVVIEAMNGGESDLTRHQRATIERILPLMQDPEGTSYAYFTDNSLRFRRTAQPAVLEISNREVHLSFPKANAIDRQILSPDGVEVDHVAIVARYTEIQERLLEWCMRNDRKMASVSDIVNCARLARSLEEGDFELDESTRDLMRRAQQPLRDYIESETSGIVQWYDRLAESDLDNICLAVGEARYTNIEVIESLVRQIIDKLSAEEGNQRIQNVTKLARILQYKNGFADARTELDKAKIKAESLLEAIALFKNVIRQDSL